MIVETVFKLRANGTTVRTEIMAGVTTFMTMAYIIALNPNLLTNWRAGGDELWNAVFLATCLASGISMVCMAFLANKPFCLAPGMGLNSFFAVIVTQIATLTGATYIASFQAALTIVLAEGIVFLVLTLCNVVGKVVASIPTCIRLGMAPAIGLLLLDIGMGSNAGVMDGQGTMFYVLRDFFGALTPSSAAATMTDAFPAMVVTVATMMLGLLAIVLLEHRGTRGSVLLGMIGASVFYWVCQAVFLGTNPFANMAEATWVPSFKDLAGLTLFKFNIEGFLQLGWATAVSLVVTLCLVDLFDTLGYLLGVAEQAEMVEDDESMPWLKPALTSDSVGTIVGACTGTSTITTFAESTAGIAAGGRTGLTTLTCGILFFLCVFVAPIVAVIPAPATSAALVYVGIMMLRGLEKVKWRKLEDAVPIALMLIAMPVSGSIGHAIGLGMIAFSAINIFTGQANRKYLATYILSIVFLISFFFVV